MVYIGLLSVLKIYKFLVKIVNW